jgi:DNA-binding transcriptional regulator YhcF (GntR family)
MLIDTSEKPKYLQLVEHLRRQIDTGKLQPGDRLPSYAEMRKAYGLTQPTIDRSHALLEKDGYIERVARKGIFVAAPNAVKAEVDKHNLLSSSVVVLTSFSAERWSHHHQTGWGEYIPLGAINEIRTSSLHVMSLDPNKLQNSDIAYFLQRPPAGAVIIGDSNLPAPLLKTAQQMQGVGIPVVVYGDEPELANFDRVISDHESGSYELTRWLIERGCRRILRARPMRPSKLLVANARQRIRTRDVGRRS